MRRLLEQNLLDVPSKAEQTTANTGVLPHSATPQGQDDDRRNGYLLCVDELRVFSDAGGQVACDARGGELGSVGEAAERAEAAR